MDGFLAGVNGETDLFAAVSDFIPSETHNTTLLADIDEVLPGRRTYELFAAHRPTAEDEPMARQLNAMPKTVWGEHARPV